MKILGIYLLASFVSMIVLYEMKLLPLFLLVFVVGMLIFFFLFKSDMRRLDRNPREDRYLADIHEPFPKEDK